MHNLILIIKREYLERVKRKSFIITTILMPLFMVGLMALPALIMVFSSPEDKSIAVIDSSEVIASSLKSGDEIKFVPIDNGVSLDSIKKLDDYEAVLYIGRDVVQNPNNVQFYTHSAPSMQTEIFITSQLEEAIRGIRKSQFDIPNLDEILERIDVDVNMNTFRLDAESGSEQATSSFVSYMIAMVLEMIMYMFILIYGQMVMTSIIEEKNSRVLELIVSSVRPKTLMLGKVLGIGLVAVTQILIWGALVGCFSRWIMPMITSGIDTTDTDVLAAFGQIADTGYVLSLFCYIILFFMGGFLLYSSIYAAIGSAVDNIQDASQLTNIATVPILLGIVVAMAVVQDPTSTMSFWFSMIPLTSPMVMMARIPFGVPGWQIWVSLAILIVSFLLMIWLTAKIYRVGIFMYGKKPTFKDLIRWAKYK